MTAAIIVAAGSGTRMGFDKLLAPLAGHPVIGHTLLAFEACADIDGIWVVSGTERGEIIRDLAEEMRITKLRGIVPGGAERHFSVWNGMQALPAGCELVAVHDGARPLIQHAQISRCVEKAASTGAAASARKVTETVKRADAEGRVTAAVDRDGLWIMETPQVFSLPRLRAAYEDVLRRGELVTDEVSALELAGHATWLVENRAPNPKITLPGDIEAAERWMSGKSL
jgi:2-C-methyl-D-erythritol 4-phosphate cytidylyltransferase